MPRVRRFHDTTHPPRPLDTALDIELRYEPSRLEHIAFDLGVAADDLRCHLRCEIDRRRVRRLPHQWRRSRPEQLRRAREGADDSSLAAFESPDEHRKDCSQTELVA